MANVTDPLARPIHGTNPQNLIEYITRQRIYDSQYWKEHLFGCTAADVAEKAALQLQAIGGSYGGNAKPTRFLCLVLKMLQIQPDDEIVDELINNENFKYVRALGAFYLRLTGRPADIYEKLEPLYNDYRKLKYRNPTDWNLLHIDEFVDQLLKEDRVCGIALPRLPNRDVLVDSGYLDGPRLSAVSTLLELPPEVDDIDDAIKLVRCKDGVKKVQSLLMRMAQDGNTVAIDALTERGHTVGDQETVESLKIDLKCDDAQSSEIAKKDQDEDKPLLESSKKRQKSSDKKKSKSKKKFGSLFKATSTASTDGKDSTTNTKSDHDTKEKEVDQSDNYWNDQRAKLGLKPLRE
jgi:pre-mRNA-splicing factor 38A